MAQVSDLGTVGIVLFLLVVLGLPLVLTIGTAILMIGHIRRKIELWVLGLVVASCSALLILLVAALAFGPEAAVVYVLLPLTGLAVAARIIAGCVRNRIDLKGK